MTKPKKKPALVINASVWLKDEERFAVLENVLGDTVDGESRPTAKMDVGAS